MDKVNKLGEEKILKLIISYSLPGIIGMLVGALYNIVDRIFIGNGVGTLGIAGIAITFPVMMVIIALSTLIGMGATALVSIKLGEKKNDEVQKIVGNAFALLMITSVMITIPVLIFIEPVLKAFGATKEVLPYAKDYASVILMASIFMIVGSGMNNLVRAGGSPKRSMMTLFIGSILNVILTPIFIFGFKMGIKGAAIATAISQIVSAMWVLSYFFGNKNILKINIKNMKLKGEIVAKIIGLGVGSFITQFTTGVIYIILNNTLVQYGGYIEVSGMGVVSTVQTLVMLPLWGISLGIQPIIGYNYGAEKYERVKEILKTAVIIATTMALFAFIVMRIFPQQIIQVFNSNDKELIQFGSKAILWYLLCTPLLGIQIIGAGYFQAIGKPKQAIILSLTRQALILIPSLLIIPRFLGMQGILISGPISDFCSTLIVVLFIVANFRAFNNKAIESSLENLVNN